MGAPPPPLEQARLFLRRSKNVQMHADRRVQELLGVSPQSEPPARRHAPWVGFPPRASDPFNRRVPWYWMDETHRHNCKSQVSLHPGPRCEPPQVNACSICV